MRIEHLAIWVKDLDKMKEFYIQYFGANSNDLYHNPNKQFKSYFLSFDTGARVEIMHKPNLPSSDTLSENNLGYAHFAVSVGSKKQVDQLTERLRSDGYSIIGEPRTTGDGYYESVIADPEGNLIEITV